MARYSINLPDRIPGNLFDNLDGIRNHEGKRIMPIVRSLEKAYGCVEKDTYSQGASPVDALAQNFNRSLRDDSRSANSLTKMFKPVADDYVREAPREAPVRQVRFVQPNEPVQEQLTLFG